MQEELGLDVPARVVKVKSRKVVEANRIRRALKHGVSRRRVCVEEGDAEPLDHRPHAACKGPLLAEGIDRINVERGAPEDERGLPP